MGVCPVIETERLRLRPLCEDDLDTFTTIFQTPEVRVFLHLPDDYGRTQAWAAMASTLGQWELRGTGQWALEERVTGALVGRAGTHRPEVPDWPGIEIGWTLHPRYWGAGYATEAGAAAIEHAFANHDVDAVYSVILTDNLRSSAVASRLGFTLFETRVVSSYPFAPRRHLAPRRALA